MRLTILPIAGLLLFVLAPVVFAQKQAEIVVLSTYLRKEPNVDSEKLRTLEKGARVAFEKSRKVTGWTYVSTDGGALRGWILDITFKAVEPNEKPAVRSAPGPVPNPPAKIKTAPVPATPTPSPIPTPTPSPDAPPENDNEVLQIETEEVSLNVRVVNAANRPVGNLKESAFRVYEDDVLQPVTSVSTAEVPVFNALVIDNSRSLRTQLSKVVEAGKIITGASKPADESTVVRFVSADRIEVVQDFTSKKALVDNALDNLYVEGGQTAIIDAVYRTAEMVGKYQNSQKKEDVKLRALILVTDGDDRASRTDEKQLFELLRNSYVQIYAIGLTDGLSDAKDAETGVSRREKARAFLTRLARETGGKVYFPKSPAELTKIAAEIAGELRTQYVVSYAPTNNARDGGFRRIRVEVTGGADGEKRTAITRTGRNAGKD